jgi:hypothetical protein
MDSLVYDATEARPSDEFSAKNAPKNVALKSVGEAARGTPSLLA